MACRMLELTGAPSQVECGIELVHQLLGDAHDHSYDDDDQFSSDQCSTPPRTRRPQLPRAPSGLQSAVQLAGGRNRTGLVR